MIVCFTGHRPSKLGGFNIPNPTYIKICKKIEAALLELKPDHAISGMALGVDQWAAAICIKLGIPFTAAIPFKGQEAIWPAASKRIYEKILAKAAKQVIVSGGSYTAVKLQIRNEWMVDNSDMAIAIWDGTKGGTGNCVDYINKVNKQMYRINPND